MYFDDGKFKLRTFGKENRSEDEIQANEVSINELIDIDDFTMPNEELSDPFINCCFISDEKIYVALYHGYSMTHYHFVWNLKTKSMEDVVPFKQELEDSSPKNFPFKSFYSEEMDQIFCFYRQGQAFTMKCSKMDEVR